MGWLDDKVIFVTGGGSGIGRAALEAFVREGAVVGVLERFADKVEDLRRQLGQHVLAMQGDAALLDDNERAVDQTVQAFGRIDALVTFPGIFDSFLGLADFPKDKLSDGFNEIFNVNVKSCLLSTRAALPELLKTEGNIVLTVSNAGFHAGGGGVLYTASKFAVRGLVTQLAYELAPKIRVNGVAPGGTRTDIRGLKTLGLDETPMYGAWSRERSADVPPNNPLHVWANPEDHASAYVYLASKERTRTVTGAIIRTDGGLEARGLMKLAGIG